MGPGVWVVVSPRHAGVAVAVSEGLLQLAQPWWRAGFVPTVSQPLGSELSISHADLGDTSHRPL